MSPSVIQLIVMAGALASAATIVLVWPIPELVRALRSWRRRK